MIILGIDPGFHKTGYSIFKKEGSTGTLITSGLIVTDTKQSIAERMAVICSTLTDLIALHRVEHAAMEQLFFFKNAKTVIGVAQAQGAIMQTVNLAHIPLTYLTPMQIKQAVTGNGHADKTSVWKMLKLQLGITITVADDDESDAIACGFAFCVLQHGLEIHGR